jgi:hypothetical protein
MYAELCADYGWKIFLAVKHSLCDHKSSDLGWFIELKHAHADVITF